MKFSQAAVKLVQDAESCVLKAYPDPGTGGDPWTVGWGHTGPEVVPGYEITQAEADADLWDDMKEAEETVNSMVEAPLNQNQFDALVSFVYNIGGDQFSRSTMRRMLNGGKYNEAAEQFPIWNRGGGKVLGGLVKRRAAEKALFLKEPP